ncbi:Uncharacterised protein family (UPF0231) [Citrobacter koseri]|nr:Uncharacterised protein family (UPF0231) [Citrobacter koseri]
MDYEFLRDITGVVKVRMSMGHEVVGHWFNEEVKENLALLDEVEQAARALKGSERSWQRAGHEYTLWMDGEEVMVRANQLEFTGGRNGRGDELLRRRELIALRRGGTFFRLLRLTVISFNNAKYGGASVLRRYAYTAGILRP